MPAQLPDLEKLAGYSPLTLALVVLVLMALGAAASVFLAFRMLPWLQHRRRSERSETTKDDARDVAEAVAAAFHVAGVAACPTDEPAEHRAKCVAPWAEGEESLRRWIAARKE